MRVAVVGAGAIGCWLATRLAASGAAEVHVVARGRALTAIREFGLRLEDALDGDAEAAVHATDDAAEVGPVDAVLFSVKSYDAVDAQVADDARRAMWDKFAFIVAVSGLTAATRLPIGELRDRPAAWSLFRRVVEEAYAVARASGVDVPAGAVDTVLSFAEGLPGQSRSSLYDDLAAGRRLEADALQGAVVRIGAELGVPTPSCETLAGVLAPHAAGRRVG